MRLRHTGTFVLLLGDVFCFVASLWLSLYLRTFSFPTGAVFLQHLVPFSFLFLVWIGVFFILELYERRTLAVVERMPLAIVQAQVANVIIAALFFFFAPWFGIAPKTTLLIYLGVSVGSILFWRLLIVPKLRPRVPVTAYLIGEGKEIDAIAHELTHNPRHGIILKDKISASAFDAKKILARARQERPRVIVFDAHHEKLSPYARDFSALVFEGTRFIDTATLFEDLFQRVPLTLIDETKLLTEEIRDRHSAYDALKRAMDIVVALIAGVIALPFCFGGAIALRVTSSGPLFISQERVGQNNRSFELMKFRSWLFDDHGDPELHKKNRITEAGKVLRKSRIDEFPQLLNVLRGELSLIGPRPEIPTLVRAYEKELPLYNARHLVKPGLSGWAQINDYDAPRGVVDVEKTARKLSYDLYYVKHRSLVLDFHIALKTVRALLSRSGT